MDPFTNGPSATNGPVPLASQPAMPKFKVVQKSTIVPKDSRNLSRSDSRDSSNQMIPQQQSPSLFNQPLSNGRNMYSMSEVTMVQQNSSGVLNAVHQDHSMMRTYSTMPVSYAGTSASYTGGISVQNNQYNNLNHITGGQPQSAGMQVSKGPGGPQYSVVQAPNQTLILLTTPQTGQNRPMVSLGQPNQIGNNSGNGPMPIQSAAVTPGVGGQQTQFRPMTGNLNASVNALPSSYLPVNSQPQTYAGHYNMAAAANAPTQQQVGMRYAINGGQTVMQQPSQMMTMGNSSQMPPQASSAMAPQSNGPVPPPATGQPQVLTPEDAKKKCRNFLATLIKLANNKERESFPGDTNNTSTKVTKLIQDLINNSLTAKEFTEELERVLKSAPQPHLVSFLERSLPDLRQALSTGEMSIEGISPPLPYSLLAAATSQPSTSAQAVSQIRPQMPPTSVVPGTPNLLQQLRGSSPSVNVRLASPAPSTSQVASSPSGSSAAPTRPSRPLKASRASRQPNTPATPEKFKDTGEDDINDVAAMGGVNLAEESQRILAPTTDLLSTDTRSCQDEYFLSVVPLQRKLSSIAREYGLDDQCSQDVAHLVSHAAEQRLKDIVEKLSVIVEHRLDNLKTNRCYEQNSDVRSQLRFLEEMDKIEKQKHEEREKEMLFRMAKSRSKAEDPEQQKLKQKAKELQKAEQEELRNRDANMAAEFALRSRKKARTDAGPSKNSASDHPFLSPSEVPTTAAVGNITSVLRTQASRPKIKRVNLRDLQFLLLQEKDVRSSTSLFRTFFSK